MRLPGARWARAALIVWFGLGVVSAIVRLYGSPSQSELAGILLAMLVGVYAVSLLLGAPAQYLFAHAGKLPTSPPPPAKLRKQLMTQLATIGLLVILVMFCLALFR